MPDTLLAVEDHGFIWRENKGLSFVDITNIFKEE